VISLLIYQFYSVLSLSWSQL